MAFTRTKQGVGSDLVKASATFTPAATSHTAGDVTGGAQEFPNLTGPMVIVSATFEISGGTAEATGWTLHLYGVTPPSAIADDAAFDVPAGDRASYLGQIALGTAVDLGTTQWIESHGINKPVNAETGLFGYLVNGTTVNTAAVAHIVTLYAVAI